ncbi:MAG: phosphoglycerate kinase [Polyangiaceae bacterium]|nr:phosphoglycerate kinase [Polyangiaceae bacterium]
MFQDLPLLEGIPLENQRVLVRVDLDVPVGTGEGTAADDTRLRALLPTLERVVGAGARLVVAGHRLRAPADASTPSIEPVAARLAELTGWEVHVPDESAGEVARKLVSELRAGQICCLENLLADPGEERRDEAFARELARLADVYVLDSLGLVDRDWASVTLLPRALKHRAIGVGLAEDLQRLSRIVGQPARPVVAIIGGNSLNAMLPVIGALRQRVDAFCFAGGVGHTLLAAEATDLGNTPLEPDSLPGARTLLAQLRSAHREVLLPSDVVVTSRSDATEGEAVSVRSVPANATAIDIGPATIDRYRARCAASGTVIWIGSVGLPTSPAATSGGRLLATTLAVSGAFTAVVGDAARAARSAGPAVVSRLGLVTEAEAAVSAALLGQRLPALEALG